jgi:outer membrane protein assembly factor BamB
MNPRVHWLAVAILIWPVLGDAQAEDWPMFGRDRSRNAISPEKNPPLAWHLKGTEKRDADGKGIGRYSEDKNVRWSTDLGSFSTGSPVVANGLVWVCTNNANPREAFVKDASVLMCFRESDGKFLYQYVSPRLSGPKHDVENDWPSTAMPCTPVVEGDRIWFTTNRAEAVCLDIGPLRREGREPKLLWKYDMMKEFGTFPVVATGMATGPGTVVAVYRNYLHATTRHGSTKDGKAPAVNAPSLVCFDKDTGKVAWKDSSPIGKLNQEPWGGVLAMDIGGRAQVIAAQGDGWVRSFDVASGKPLWRFDANPKAAKAGFNGDRNSVLVTPTYCDGRIYVATGRHPEYGGGPAWLYCLDPTKQGDISAELDDGPGKGKPNPNSGVVWRCGGALPEELRKKEDRDFYFGRTISSCVVASGLLYIADMDGYFYCLDARTGKTFWHHDLKTSIYGSPIWVDGKILLGTADAEVVIFTHGKEKKPPQTIEVTRPIWSTPVFANGVLYLAMQDRLLAIRQER